MTIESTTGQTSPARRPTPSQYLGYLVGKTLPDDLRDWVFEDATGPGATRRYATRCLIPLVPLLVVLFFVPGPWLIRVSMGLLLLLPFAYFLMALKSVYLHHRLVSHGLESEPVSERKQRERDEEKDAYESRYRSR